MPPGPPCTGGRNGLHVWACAVIRAQGPSHNDEDVYSRAEKVRERCCQRELGTDSRLREAVMEAQKGPANSGAIEMVMHL
jgi:hypothetical protein